MFDKRFHNGLTTFTVTVDEASGFAKVLEESHNPPMQRTGAAGLVSFVRKLLGRGPGH